MPLVFMDEFDDAPSPGGSYTPYYRLHTGNATEYEGLLDDIAHNGDGVTVPAEGEVPIKIAGADENTIGQAWMKKTGWSEWRLAVFRNLSWTIYRPITITPRKRGRKPVSFLPTIEIAPWMGPITMTENGWGARRRAAEPKRVWFAGDRR